jgi:AraC-like DNA-binding protein
MKVTATSLWVSMPIIRNIVMASAKGAADIKSMCSTANLQVSDLENANARLTLGQNCAIMEAALHISRDEFLGLHIGEKTSPTVLGITGHLMQSSKDVLSALMNIQQFTKTFTRLYTFHLEIKGNVVYYYCEPVAIWNDLSPETARHSVDISFAGALHILRLLTGHTFRPIKVLYRYPRITNVSEHERIFRCTPLFNQPSNCILFSLKDVSQPIVGYNQELHDILKNLLETELLKNEKQLAFSDQVKHIILKNYHFSFPLLEDVAALMHITPRTLQRKLQEEQTSFRVLEDEIKKEIAINLLTNAHLTITDVALKLGYADRSSFQRAFKQWTGKTPSAFQQ